MLISPAAGPSAQATGTHTTATAAGVLMETSPCPAATISLPHPSQGWA